MKKRYRLRNPSRLMVASIATMFAALAPNAVFAAGGDFANTDFTAAAPFTYNHTTGGGAYNDRTVGDHNDITEQLEGGQFTCGDIVTYLAQIELETTTVDTNQIIELDFRFLGNSTGQRGAGLIDITGVAINYGQVENGDNGIGTNPGADLFGLDSGINDDGGSTATLVSETFVGTPFQSGAELLGTVRIDDIEAGEKIVLRIDTLLGCDHDTSPTGNLQGQLDAGRVVSADGVIVEPASVINTGQQTIPFLKVGDIFGAGEPLLSIEKTVTTENGTCGVDDVKSLNVTAGDTVKYCYIVSNPGTASLNDVEVIDDNGTAGNLSDDFTVTLTGLSDLDGDADLGDLSGVSVVSGEALVTLSSQGTVVNIGTATGNNNLSGGNYQELTASDTASVTLEQAAQNSPVANDDSATTSEDTPVVINAAYNDTDVDNNLDPTSATPITSPANGTVINNGDGTFTYVPDPDFNGTDSFDYQICDIDGLCSTATVTITVNAVNDPPVAIEDSDTINQNTSTTINVTNNDTDVDGNLDPTSVTPITSPANGNVVNNGDGTFTYTPNTDFFGQDSFDYLVCDTDGNCDITTVTIDVIEVVPENSPPVALDDSVTTDEDNDVLIDVITNNGNGLDSDPDDNLNPSSANTDCSTCSLPSNGTLVNDGDGFFTYTPNSNFNGTDSFVYEVCDTDDLCDTATVTITVNSVNDSPEANNDNTTTPEDTPVEIDVLDNDSDPENDPLTVTTVTDPANGDVTINSDDTLIYTPDQDFNGEDSFEYTICDDSGDCDTAIVTINVNPVNDPPVAVDDSATTDEDVPVIIPVLDNDTDVDGNLDSGTVNIIQQPDHGSVSIDNGTVTYTPNENYNGTDSFDYQVCDTEKACDTATVTITVNPVNDLPDANDDTYSTLEDTPLNIVAPGVLGNDSDVDGDTLTVTLLTDPSDGTLTQNSDGSFTYSPDENFNGEDSYTYKACDPTGECDTATVTILIGAENDPPVAVNDAYSTDEDTPLIVSAPGVLTNDSDVDGDTLTVTLLTDPSDGTLTQNSDGSFTYTPNENFNGEDSYTYDACDPTGECDTATVTITVNPVNDPPVALDNSYTTTQDTSIPLDMLGNDSDIDGDDIFIDSNTSLMFDGYLGSDSYGYSYTPAPGFAGIDTLTYTISDGNGGYDTATVIITVAAKNNRSISVDLQQFVLNEFNDELSGTLNISNQSGGYDVQITELAVEVQYKVPGSKWMYMGVTEDTCIFNPAPLFLVVDQMTVTFSGCQLEEALPAGATVRVTAKVKIFGRIRGKGKADSWFLDRMSY